MMYTKEGGGQRVYPGLVDGIREDKDVAAGRYCICRAMQLTWWVWEEGLLCFFWR